MRKLHTYEIKITIPVAVFDKKQIDVNHIRKMVSSECGVLHTIIQGDIMIDEDCIQVSSTTKD